MAEERTYRRAFDRLTAAQKSGAGVPAYLRWVNRGLGRRAAALAWVMRLTPNAVTAASAILSLCGLIVILALPLTPWTALSACALLLAGYALDSADGQLARLTGSGSLAGEWLDHVVDAARLPLFHLAIALLFVREGESPWVIAVPLMFVILSSVWFFAQTLAEKLSPDNGRVTQDAPAWVSFAKLPYDVGLLYLIVALAWALPVFVVFYSSVFAITVLVAALSLGRKYRFLKAVSHSAAIEASP